MQGLIIGIIIITFLYNVYKNFKKEMDKAKARGQDAEAIAQAKMRAEALERKRKSVYQPVVTPSYETAYDQTVAEEFTPVPVLETNRQDYFRERAKAKELRDAKSQNLKKPISDYYNPELPVAEVVTNRQIHAPHNHSFKFPHPKAHQLAHDFNFRQALIYDAILRRPEY